MILQELFKKYDGWDEVASRLVEIYPKEEKSINGYKCVFFSFLLTKPEKTEDLKNMRLCITPEYNDYIPEEERTKEDYWQDVHGKNGEFFTNEDGTPVLGCNGKPWEQTWSLVFEPRKHWAALEVDEETLAKYPEIDIVCHALWEMTFMGFDEEDVEAKKNELDKRCEEIEDGIAESISWEDALKRYGDFLESKEADNE